MDKLIGFVKTAYQSIKYHVGRHVIILLDGGTTDNLDLMLADHDRKYGRTPIEAGNMNEMLGDRKLKRHEAA